MMTKGCISSVILFAAFVLFPNVAEKLTYVSVERSTVEYTNPKYVPYANISSFRFGRMSYVYYTNLFFETLLPLDNKIRISFYFHEFLSNRYKPTFVEMHFKWCNLLEKDLFFGAAMKQGKLAGKCPYPPGIYELYNMTILPDAIPRGFPFTKGRIICNITYIPNNANLFYGFANMELKEIKIKDRVKGSKL